MGEGAAGGLCRRDDPLNSHEMRSFCGLKSESNTLEKASRPHQIILDLAFRSESRISYRDFNVNMPLRCHYSDQSVCRTGQCSHC